MSRYNWSGRSSDCYDEGKEDARRGNMNYSRSEYSSSDCDRAYYEGRNDYERECRDRREEERMMEEQQEAEHRRHMEEVRYQQYQEEAEYERMQELEEERRQFEDQQPEPPHDEGAA